jgi:DNA-binding response OmpR family regulator
MIAGRLGTVTDAYLPEGQLRLDEDGRVWIGERRVATLAGLSQKLLACLFEHEGQVVNNRMIVEAYGEKFIEGDSAREQSIRQEVSRLREDVEPDPKRPRYILTERGKGYRLKASGEPDK